MSDFKVSQNQTGTLFYTRLGEGPNKPYRVRFKSFNLGMYENRHVIEGLDQMQTNYNVFKGKKPSSHKQSRSLHHQRQPKVHKNLKERVKEGEELKSRLKTMRDTRRSIFEKIKYFNE